MEVEPKENFKKLSEDEIHSALNDPNPNNTIALEVARLLEGYSKNFAAHCARLGYIPSDILRIAPRWPIEKIAMQLMTKTLQEYL